MEGHQGIAGGNHSGGGPDRETKNRRGARLVLRREKGPAGPCEIRAGNGGKETCHHLRGGSETGRQEARQRIHVDVPFRTCGQGTAEESGPEHAVADQRVGPEESGGEDIPENHLQECQDHHRAEEQDEQCFLNTHQEPLGSAKGVHRPLPAARFASTARSTRWRNSAG